MHFSRKWIWMIYLNSFKILLESIWISIINAKSKNQHPNRLKLLCWNTLYIGKFSLLPFIGAYTFKYKQSSLWFFSLGMICWRALNLPCPIICKAADSLRIWGSCWGQTGAKSTAFRTFLHGVTVTGGINLRDPSGAAANGIPRNTSTCLLLKHNLDCVNIS